MSLSPEQLEMRRTGVGASEIAALAGLSKWATPIQIYEAKRAGYVLDPTLPMDLGNLLEEPIARVYAKRTGKFLAPVTTIRHPSKPFALGTPDRAAFLTVGAMPDEAVRIPLNREELEGCERLVQIKSTSWRMAHEWGTPGTDEVPEDYLAQGTWEMGISGVHVEDFAVLFDKDRFETYTLHFNAQLFEGLYEIAARFMVDHVQAGIAPPPDASERYGEYLSRTFPRETAADYVASTPEVDQAMAAFAVLKLAEKKIKAAITKQKNTLCALIGEKTGLRSPTLGDLTWKKSRDTMGVDWMQAAQEARTAALMLLDNVARDRGPIAPEMIAQLRERLTSLESNHKRITRKGARKLTQKWSAPFKGQLANPDEMSRVLPYLMLEAPDESDSSEDES